MSYFKKGDIFISQLYFISDLHFGHGNIIQYENRPFQSVEDMDEKLIINWNQTVKKNARVIIAGDLSFHNKEKTKEIVGRLNGHKTLIMGNHDKARSVSWWKEVGLNDVIKYPIIIENFYIVSHEPVVSITTPYINIHGHLHSKKCIDDSYFNVSVECVDYRPILFDEIMNKYQRWELKGHRE